MEQITVNMIEVCPRVLDLYKTCKATPDDKRKQREELARLQEEFIAKGGAVEDCDIKKRTEPKKFGESRMLRGRTNG